MSTRCESREQVLRCGESQGLVGILCEPTRGHDPERPLVLLLNAGVISRIGPARFNVDLARRLAGLGFSSLRLDLSGLGDSQTRPGNLAHIERAVADIGDASEALRGRGYRRFVLVGICSGALNAHAAAVALPEICGAALLDGYTYPTRGFYLRHYGPRLLDPRRYLSFAQRKALALLGSVRARLEATPLSALAARLPEPPQSTQQPQRERDEREEEHAYEHFPPKEQVERELTALLERRVQLLYCYSGGWNEYCNYRGQLEDTFGHLGFRGLIDVRRFPEADHTYTLLADRQRITDALVSWLEEHF
jgi:pimeloyl-ACP methyl ester carboxylesterase